MIVNMSEQATQQEIAHIVDRIRELGYQANSTEGAERTIIAAVGRSGRRAEVEALKAAPGVDDVVAIAHPFKLVSRQARGVRSVVDVGGVRIGGPEVVGTARPCSVESSDPIFSTPPAVQTPGPPQLPGGASHPPTPPPHFPRPGVAPPPSLP